MHKCGRRVGDHRDGLPGDRNAPERHLDPCLAKGNVTHTQQSLLLDPIHRKTPVPGRVEPLDLFTPAVGKGTARPAAQGNCKFPVATCTH